jgi:glycosyltransferase involved in cell wall biosynthesis
MTRAVSNVRVSVALCSYQGARYLPEQLDSIAEQTRPPDEMIICDDGSTDGTIEIVKRFRSQAPFPVRELVNDERLGYTRNFERAIALCEGDIIFLSDQDDVWHPDKLNIQLGVFDRSPDVGAVFTDADLVDARLVPRGQSLWGFVGFGATLQKRFAKGGAFDLLLKRNVVTGTTMGFRGALRDLVLPIPADWVHDHWISALIAAVTDVAMVPRRLVRYRQHEGQAIGARKTTGMAKAIEVARMRLVDKRKLSASSFLRAADQYAAVRERLNETLATYPCSTHVLHRLEERIGHFRARARMRTGKGRLRLLMREALALNYQRYSSGWKSIAVDVFLP